MQLDTYSGGGLNPVQDSVGAQTDAVNLAAGKSFPQGSALGQVLGSGTAVAEVQTLTATGTVSGGTYRLQYNGETTTSLAYNASNATIQAALEALPSIGTGGVTAGGGAFPGTPVTFTFAGSLAGLSQPLIIAIGSVTGGGSVAVTRTTLGVPANGYWDLYDDAASGSTAGLAVARRLNKFAVTTDSQGRVYAGSAIGSSDNRAYTRTAVTYHAGTFKTADIPNLDANGCNDLGKLISGTTSVLTDAKTLLRIG